MFGVLPAHLPLVLDAGTVFVFVPPLTGADFVYCHCPGSWAVLDNTHGKGSGAFRWGLLYSHYHGPYFYLTEVYTCCAMLQDRIKFILAMLCYRTVFMWLQGTWFWQIAYTLFNPSLGEKPTMDVNDPESVMVTTLYFSFHIIAACSCKLSPPIVTIYAIEPTHWSQRVCLLPCVQRLLSAIYMTWYHCMGRLMTLACNVLSSMELPIYQPYVNMTKIHITDIKISSVIEKNRTCKIKSVMDLSNN